MAMERTELVEIAAQITEGAIRMQEDDPDTMKTDKWIADEIRRLAFYRSDRDALERMIHHNLTGQMPDW